MKTLILDNYDSFTYNLVHLVEYITGEKVDVYRNDAISLPEVASYDKIILSPGPGIPQESGILLPLIKAYAETKPILGVCLGHQAIGEAFGGRLINLKEVYHGVATPIYLMDGKSRLFENLPPEIKAGRYHSWVVSEEGLPDCLEITARDEHNYIMGLQHKTLDICGVQFHPESVLTSEGEQLMRNWLNGH